MRIVHFLLPVAVAVVVPFPPAQAQASTAPRWAAAVDSMMRDEMVRAKAPGAQIGIMQGDRLVYARGYGVADAASGRPVTARTLFHIGSVTKTVTGMLLSQLASEGTVDLDAPISRYVTELAGKKVGAVTTRQLLTHSAGFLDNTTPSNTRLGDLMRTVSDTLVIMEPGRLYSYSSPGFDMAGYVAERATKTPYVQLAERMVLRKAGMTYATWLSDSVKARDFSQGHLVPPTGPATVVQPLPTPAAHSPAGFLYANAAEVARLGAVLVNGGALDGERVLSPEAARRMTTGDVPIPGMARARTGYGVDVDTVGGRRVWRKNGLWVGGIAMLSMWPDDRLSIAVLVNRSGDMAGDAVLRAAQIVAGIPLPSPALNTEYVATGEERAQLVGRYRLVNGMVGEIVDSGGRLQVVAQGQSTPLTMLGRDRLTVTFPGQAPSVIYVVRDSSGAVRYLHQRGRALVRLP